jgi:hypothetical protein
MWAVPVGAYVGALFLIDWVQYGFDFDVRRDGTRGERMFAMGISIPAMLFATAWYLVDWVIRCLRTK